MIIFNEDGLIVDTKNVEAYDQYLANKYILKNDVVLELGARYGSVSCVINSKLDNKYNQVVVEPDTRVWDVLEKNKKMNNCGFNIVKGFISNKKLCLTNLDANYETTSVETDNTDIPSYTLLEIEEKYNLNFNALVADCEGFLEIFFDENPELYDKLDIIIFEADCPEKCNYEKIKMNLKNTKFINILNGVQNVWVKDSVYKKRGIRSSKYVPVSNLTIKTIFKPRNIRSNSNAYTELSFT
jgi:FkbM family methyltransferase